MGTRVDMSGPPTYEKSQEAGGHNSGVGAPVVITHQPQIMFDRDPVTTTCRNCGNNITTSVHTETGVIAWITAGVCCALGCWLGCCCIPLCMDSMKDATHQCPNCNAVVGRFKAKF